MKPFFYRIDAGALIDFATDAEGESITLLQFAKELRKGQSEIAFIQSIIDEAHQFINQKSEAGKKGMKNRWDKAKSQPITELNTVITNYNTDITELNTVITNDNTPVTRSSSSNRKEKEINKEKESIPFEEVLSEMNQLLGTNFRLVESNKKFIRARWQDGYRKEDFATVCQNMMNEWSNDPKMTAYLRPETLFGQKMDSYLNRVQKKPVLEEWR